MLTTKISEEDYKVLEEYFNNYCLFIYNRLYPITDNNLKEYFADIILNYKGYSLELDRCGIDNEQFWIDGYYLIDNNKLYEKSRLIQFNNYINERINK